jgi:hypothetical protein
LMAVILPLRRDQAPLNARVPARKAASADLPVHILGHLQRAILKTLDNPSVSGGSCPSHSGMVPSSRVKGGERDAPVSMRVRKVAGRHGLLRD